MPFEVLWLLEMLLCCHVDEEDEQGVAYALPSPLLVVAESDAPISCLETWNIKSIKQSWILIATESRKGPYTHTHIYTDIYLSW
jgi:hypothetical protein